MPARGNVACRAATTGFSPDTSLASRVTVTWSCAALSAGETAVSLTLVTPATCLARCPSRVIAAVSALVSLVSERAATMVMRLVVRDPSSGAPSVSAWTLGVEFDRNRLGSLLTSLPSDGSAIIAAAAAMTHPAMTSSRNRTTRAARASKNLITGPRRVGRSEFPSCSGVCAPRR